MKVTILGCGASAGVPIIGCGCEVCISGNPKNKRCRVSILVEYDNGTRVLVDTSPDLRMQAITNHIPRVDAVIYTHSHADHTHGIDDLRAFNCIKDGEIDVYAAAETMTDLRERFPYVWRKRSGGSYWMHAVLNAHVVMAGEDIVLPDGNIVRTFNQNHGTGTTLGLRFNDVVYSTDVNGFDETAEPFLHDMRTWIVDCLRDGPAGSHASLDMALAWVERYQPQQAILTHMNHELDYDALCARLPQHVRPAYDGMVITSP